ncbi:thioredoxin, mitochondrial-like [Penaeus monodon]|uniref:thioredoxin, mitochondrial-like n=1 Tax=Penaeus monodon TaxID=6687 RepID=UPI0018A6FD56|nr:thioredoxin, mitochondrial-like [Penaeus monodon]
MFRRSLAQLASATNRALWKDLEGRFLAPLVPARGLKTTSTDRALFNVQDEEDFTERVLKSSTPVVVDFHAQWCGPCKLLGPRLETIIGSKGDKVHLAKVDIDDVSDLALEYGVTAVPSVLAVKGGKVVDKFVGLQEESRIESFVGRLIGE